jgi:hypothetical protein
MTKISFTSSGMGIFISAKNNITAIALAILKPGITSLICSFIYTLAYEFAHPANITHLIKLYKANTCDFKKAPQEDQI